MAIFATSGSQVYIGDALDPGTSDLALSDFGGQSWTEIGWVQNLGTFGDTSQEVTFDSIDQSRTQKLKGTRNAGNMALVTGVDYSDAGQVALIAAEQTSNDYAFKIVFNDAPSGGTASERYFVGKVMSVAEQLDGANNVARMNATIGINSNIVQVLATV